MVVGFYNLVAALVAKLVVVSDHRFYISVIIFSHTYRSRIFMLCALKWLGRCDTQLVEFGQGEKSIIKQTHTVFSVVIHRFFCCLYFSGMPCARFVE